MRDSSLNVAIRITASYLQFTSSPCDLYCRKPAFNDQRPIKINEVSLHEIMAWGMSHILNIIPKLEAIGIVRKFPWNNVSGSTVNVQANERCYNIQYTHWHKLHNLSSRHQQIQTLCRLQNVHFNRSFWKIINSKLVEINFTAICTWIILLFPVNI